MKKDERTYSWTMLLIILLIGILSYFFLNQSYHDFISSLVISLTFVALLLFAYKKNMSSFILVFIIGFFMFISLGISFGKPYTGTSPIALHIILNQWIIFFISLLTSLLVYYWYQKSKYKHKFPFIMIVMYVILWIILSINVKYFDDWKMENYLTVPFVLLLLFTFKKFKLSNLSYTLIFAYMTMHIIGTHYTYSEVPFGFWLQSFFNLPRNHYDRIVHFSFGLLLYYPIREIAIRIGNLKGAWNLYFPVDFVLAFSCIYELIEWGIAVIFGGDLGIAYLGTQGDIWDAQKDMFMAGLGSIIAMLITTITIWYYNSEGFIKEIRESMKIKSKQVLGENAIQRYLRNNKK